MSSINFKERVYNELKKIPAGKVITYMALARRAKSNAARAVGTLMKNNSQAPVIPCHRVILASGKIGQYAFGQKKKIALLKSEGIKIVGNKVVDRSQIIR